MQGSSIDTKITFTLNMINYNTLSDSLDSMSQSITCTKVAKTIKLCIRYPIEHSP